MTRLSYDAVWNALKATDQDPANAGNVIELYTGDSVPKSDNGGGPDQWNREHVWAKSHGDFGTATGPGTDIHHLRPDDVTVNSARGNLDFDEGGTENAEAPGNYADGDSWEPRDAVKGDVARMIFYMSVRYEGTDGFADLEVNDATGNGSAPHIGKLSRLLEWNARTRPTRSRCVATTSSSRPTSTTGTRSSTTPSGPRRSGTEGSAQAVSGGLTTSQQEVE